MSDVFSQSNCNNRLENFEGLVAHAIRELDELAKR